MVVGAKGFELKQCAHCKVEPIPCSAGGTPSNKHTSIGSTPTLYSNSLCYNLMDWMFGGVVAALLRE